MSPLEPIAMIGIGCRLPGGVRSADDLWELLVNGVDAITETPESRWRLQAKFHSDPARPGRITSRFGGFIDGVRGEMTVSQGLDRPVLMPPNVPPVRVNSE